MKVELHCHTTRYSGCAVWSPMEMLANLSAAGYGAVYLTEHDAVWEPRELAELQGVFPRLKIFPGVELALGKDMEIHLLVLGTTNPAFVRQHDPREVIRMARAEGCMTVLAHPFRYKDVNELLGMGELPDAMELWTCNHADDKADRSQDTARRLSLPLVNAGDLHAPSMLGRYWIETAVPLEDPKAIRDVVLLGSYRNCPQPV